MLTRVQAGKLSLTGVSVGGIYTSISVAELDVIFDIGIAPRSFVGPRHLFLSHGHADHVGALTSLLGVRGLSRAEAPRIFLPCEIARDVEEAVAALNRAQRRALVPSFVPLSPGDEQWLYGDLWARAFRTLHTVPSLGYELFRRVDKLRPEFRHLPPTEIRERRKSGEDLFSSVERGELVYATDTLIDVLDREPRLYQSRVLVLECTFLDERKGRRETREKCHVHLEEILERAELFENEHLVLMHFSQLYSPTEVHEILKRRCPPRLASRLVAFAPTRGQWPG